MGVGLLDLWGSLNVDLWVGLVCLCFSRGKNVLHAVLETVLFRVAGYLKETRGVVAEVVISEHMLGHSSNSIVCYDIIVWVCRFGVVVQVIGG